MKPTTLFLIAFLFCHFAYADNGELAFAHPVSGINIDGQFSDWPENLPAFPIVRTLSAGEFEPGEDFTASFRAGHDLSKGHLYLALTVIDNSHQITGEADPGWSEWDSVIAYFDPQHHPAGSGSQLYTATGEHRMLLANPLGWDPASASMDWNSAEAAVQRLDDRTHYEWRFDLLETADAGSVLGLDFLICDRDDGDSADDVECYIWGPGSGKSQSGGRLGDVVLLQKDAAMGQLQGRVAWIDTDTPPAENGMLSTLRISRGDDSDWAINAGVDADGQYSLMLPAGSYQITAGDHWLGHLWTDFHVIAEHQGITANVSAGQTSTADPLTIRSAPPPDLLEKQGALFDYTTANQAELENVIRQYMDYYRVPGTSIALVKDGKLVYHGTFGYQNKFTGKPVSSETLFEAASITKIVFAFAVNRLAERGVIDMDKPLYEYLPYEDIAHDERYKKITARLALSHQTGFPNWRFFNDDGQLDIKFYPGIKYGYSGEGFEYLGKVVAHITGKPLEQILLEEVQQPMGFVEQTYFSNSEALQAVASHGHYGYHTAAHTIPDEPGMAHSMYTEAKTFSNFMLNLIARKGLSADGYEKMLEPQIEVPLDDDHPLDWPNRYGLGFHMMNSPFGRVFGHGGNNGDFTCMFEIYDEHGMGFIVFTNSDTGAPFYLALRRYLIMGSENADN